VLTVFFCLQHFTFILEGRDKTGWSSLLVEKRYNIIVWTTVEAPKNTNIGCGIGTIHIKKDIRSRGKTGMKTQETDIGAVVYRNLEIQTGWT
jgi:hypothetical protein